MALELGVMFQRFGRDSEPQVSIKKRKDDSPWSLCRRPWSLMYITANGQALPCCIAPFSMRGYDSFTLGNATQQTMREIWNGEKYQELRRALLSPEPPSSLRELAACAGASDLDQVVSVVIPALNEAESIAAVVREMPWALIRECIVVDNGSTDATAAEAKAAGAQVLSQPQRRLRPRLRSRGSSCCDAGSNILVFMDAAMAATCQAKWGNCYNRS